MTSALASPPKDQHDATSETVAPTLSEMQVAFQRAVMHGDDTVLSELLDNSRTDRTVLFGVYRNAYVARLIEVIRNDHPLLHAYLGDDAFNDIAKAYIAARPSQNQNARWFSHRLPEFLSDERPKTPELAELASLERALNDAFDAPDSEAVTIADLSAVPPESWSDLIFEPHPSAQRLVFATNAHALWLALKNDQTPPQVEGLSDAESIMVWRHDTTPKVRRMSAEEAMMWNEAVNGVPFGNLCELIAVYDDPETAPLRAAQHLQGWIVSGLLARSHAED